MIAVSTPILATKLYIPPPRAQLILRLRLTSRLSESLHLGQRLTLISAPPGFGKTTLLSEWLYPKDEEIHPSSFILPKSPGFRWMSMITTRRVFGVT